MKISKSQIEAIKALQQGDLGRDAAKLQEAELSISAGLERSPDDLMFLNLQGYQHKNWAMLKRDKQREELDKAERLFSKIIAIEPRDPSALNGLGSVALIRGDLAQAERFIRQALAQEPDYLAAQRDLHLVHQIQASGSPR